MTNFERIKNMTVEELAKFLCDNDNHCNTCEFRNDPEKCELTIEPTIFWLTTPVYNFKGDKINEI